jgi:inner membrane protein
MENQKHSPGFMERYSALIKMTVIGILVLLFMIPTSMIEGLIRERGNRQDEVMREISNSWGGQQSITGPVLSVPYYTSVRDNDGTVRSVKEYLHLLPEQINVSGNIRAEKRKRKIYQMAVYKGNFDISGNFKVDKSVESMVGKSTLNWNETSLWIGLTDLKGIKEHLSINWGGRDMAFQPGLTCKDLAGSGVSVPVNLTSDSASRMISFSMKMKLNGSESLYFYPVGEETNVKLKGVWSDPSFTGAFLPDNRLVKDSGFSADWKILHHNRNFPQVFKSGEQSLVDYDFGVNLVLPVDHYQKSTRSVKYAVMFIALTFLVFFFTEVINKKPIHPIQYILIGLALVVFYTLLISLAEQVGFNWAYMIGSVSIVSLVTYYTHAVLQSGRLTAIMGSVLAVLYGFIFTIIQLEDYALLFGSIGLFVFIAAMMVFSRKIDWYGINGNERSES